MKIGVIGAGNVGGNLARRLAEVGHDVHVANSRDPATLDDFADATGTTPSRVTDVARGADLVIVSIPEKNVPDLPPNVLEGIKQGAPVIDTGNYYPKDRDGLIQPIEAGAPESRWVEQQLNHPVIKAFNGILAPALVDEARPAGDARRLGVAIAGDDADAKRKVMALVDELGFDPVDAGGIDQSWRMQPGTPWYGKGLDANGVREALNEASPRRPAEFSAAV